MNVLELREKTPDELDEQLALLKKELFNLRFQKAFYFAQSANTDYIVCW